MSQKTEIRTSLERTLESIPNKRYKCGNLNYKINMILNLKFEDKGLNNRISKAIYHLYKERLKLEKPPEKPSENKT